MVGQHLTDFMDDTVPNIGSRMYSKLRGVYGTKYTSPAAFYDQLSELYEVRNLPAIRRKLNEYLKERDATIEELKHELKGSRFDIDKFLELEKYALDVLDQINMKDGEFQSMVDKKKNTYNMRVHEGVLNICGKDVLDITMTDALLVTIEMGLLSGWKNNINQSVLLERTDNSFILYLQLYIPLISNYGYLLNCNVLDMRELCGEVLVTMEKIEKKDLSEEALKKLPKSFAKDHVATLTKGSGFLIKPIKEKKTRITSRINMVLLIPNFPRIILKQIVKILREMFLSLAVSVAGKIHERADSAYDNAYEERKHFYDHLSEPYVKPY